MEGKKKLFSLIVGEKSPAPQRLHPANREELYKKSGLGMPNDRRNRRNQSHQTHQKNKKIEAHFARRGIHLDSVEEDDVVDENEPKKISQKNKAANDRAMKLAEYRIKKEMRLKEKEQNKKPPFNVGVYKGFDHKYISKNLPFSAMPKRNKVFVFGGTSTENVKNGAISNVEQPISKRTTRSQAQPNVVQPIPSRTSRSQKAQPKVVEVVEQIKKLNVLPLVENPIQINVIPPSEVEASDDSETPKILKNKDKTPPRKEPAKALDKTFTPEDATKNSQNPKDLENEDKVSEKLQKELEMENDEKTHDVSYFKNILKKNDDAMAHFVKVWTNKVNEMERSNVKEDICGKIRSTIGKAILLTNKKGRFEQFRTLIENCEFGLGEKATTCMDLQGFWEMIYFQVQDVEKLFIDLEQLEKKNWVEDEPKKPILKKKQIQKKRVLKPKQSTVAAPSNLRQMLMDKRKAMKEKSEKLDEGISFDAGFFKVETTPKRLSVSPRNDILTTNSAAGSLNSLRKDVLTKQVSKSAGVNPSTPLVVIRATKASRRSMSRENSPVIQLNFDADDVKEDKENEENFGPDGFKTPKKTAKTPAKTPKFDQKFLGTQEVRRSHRLSTTPRKDYKEK